MHAPPAPAARRTVPFALLVLLAFLGTAAGGPASVAGEPPAFEVPEGMPVQLDGTVQPQEWEGGLVLPLGDGGTQLRLLRRRDTLQVGFESQLAWPVRGSITLLFCPDGPEAGYATPGFVRINYEPFEHDRSHLIVTRKEGPREVRVRERVVARSALSVHRTGVELAIPLDLLGVTTDEGPAIRFSARWLHPYRRANRSWPAGLDFSGSAAGVPPPDLLSAARWGRLTAWGKRTGLGAFSKTDWDAWIEHDRELQQRGAAAHAAMRNLVEEWKKTKKRDKEIVPEILGNLAWIAEREPLSSTDLLGQARSLRFLNRCTEALGILEALVHDVDPAIANAATYEQALTYVSLGRFREAQARWTRLAERAGPEAGGRYLFEAKKLAKRIEGADAEREARAADEAAGDLPLVALHTPHGVAVIRLCAKDTPNAVAHFLDLVESKFYDGTRFCRVEGDFLAQGGDPVSRDQGCDFAGSGTSEKEIDVEVNERHGFWRGAVGFALGRRRANGSQFFILTSPKPDLLHVMSEQEKEPFTCFGYVISGMDVVDRLECDDPLTRAVVLRR